MSPNLFDTSTLDIDYVARIIARIVEQYVREMEHKARRENGTVEFTISPQDSARLAHDIRRAIEALDLARTEKIRTLHANLATEIMIHPGPMQWVGRSIITERCEARNPEGGTPCMLPKGHGGEQSLHDWAK